jgi:hypothetical protein
MTSINKITKKVAIHKKKKREIAKDSENFSPSTSPRWESYLIEMRSYDLYLYKMSPK